MFWIWSKIAALILSWLASLPVATIATPTPQVYEVPISIPTVVATQTVQQTDNLDTWIAQSNWPQWTWETVKRIVMCESRGIPGIATNPPHFGLMQANVNYWGYPSGGPVGELNQGFYIWTQQGWSAWSCY